jgi:hypothetical protein
VAERAGLIGVEPDHEAAARDVNMAWGTEKEGFRLLEMKELMLQHPDLANWLEDTEMVESGMTPCWGEHTGSKQNFGDMVTLPDGRVIDVMDMLGASPDGLVERVSAGNVRRTLAVLEVKTKSPFRLEQGGRTGYISAPIIRHV